MSRSFKDKVVIVTGSSSGIGAHAAIYFAYNYANVVLTGRNVERLNEVFKKCKESGVPRENLLVIQADITRRAELARIVDETIKRFGRIDILINNAGVGKFGGLMQTTADDFDKIMECNVKSVVNLTKLATPHLIKTKGNIVNVSALMGSVSVPAALVYSMSKAAINQFTKCVALELAPHGVRVNAICPSYVEETRIIETSMANIIDFDSFNSSKERQHPLGRNVRMEDCTKAIAFLASEDSAFITGTLLNIDGGRHCTDVSYAGLVVYPADRYQLMSPPPKTKYKKREGGRPTRGDKTESNTTSELVLSLDTQVSGSSVGSPQTNRISLRPIESSPTSSNSTSDMDVERIALKLKSTLLPYLKSAIHSELQSLKDEVSELRSENATMKIELSEIRPMASASIKTKSDIQDLYHKNDELEQYTRRNSVRISGIDETLLIMNWIFLCSCLALAVSIVSVA